MERLSWSSSGPNIVTKVLVREKQEDQSLSRRCNHGKRGQRDRGRFEDTTLMALKTEEGAVGPGLQAASSSRESREQILPQSLQKECGLADPLVLAF